MVITGGVCCSSAKDKRPSLPDCNNRGVTNDKTIIAHFDQYLRQMLRENTTDIFDGIDAETPGLQSRITTLSAEIEDLEEQARTLIRIQRTAPGNLQQLYEEELEKLGIQLNNMKDALSRLQGESLANQQTTSIQQATLEELADLTPGPFLAAGKPHDQSNAAPHYGQAPPRYPQQDGDRCS